jgi:hypothetical protein
MARLAEAGQKEKYYQKQEPRTTTRAEERSEELSGNIHFGQIKGFWRLRDQWHRLPLPGFLAPSAQFLSSLPSWWMNERK